MRPHVRSFVRRGAPVALVALAACATARPGVVPGAVPGTSPSVVAAPDPIVTDRPDYTESASVVAAPQLEAGATADRAAGATDVSLGELLLRLPVARRVEGRLNFSSVNVSRDGSTHVSGYEDPEVQAKIALGSRAEGASRLVPTTALIVGTTLPLGSRGFGERTLQPGAKLIGEWEISDRVGLASNLNYAWASEGGRRFGQTSVTASLGTGWTDRLGSFLEYYDFLPGGAGEGPAHYGDLGATYQVTPAFQLDARVGARLGARLGDARERFVGIGLARRF